MEDIHLFKKKIKFNNKNQKLKNFCQLITVINKIYKINNNNNNQCNNNNNRYPKKMKMIMTIKMQNKNQKHKTIKFNKQMNKKMIFYFMNYSLNINKIHYNSSNL